MAAGTTPQTSERNWDKHEVGTQPGADRAIDTQTRRRVRVGDTTDAMMKHGQAIEEGSAMSTEGIGWAAGAAPEEVGLSIRRIVAASRRRRRRLKANIRPRRYQMHTAKARAFMRASQSGRCTLLHLPALGRRARRGHCVLTIGAVVSNGGVLQLHCLSGHTQSSICQSCPLHASQAACSPARLMRAILRHLLGWATGPQAILPKHCSVSSLQSCSVMLIMLVMLVKAVRA